MELKDIIWSGGGALLVILTLVQISPIKIDPWSALARAIGRAINGELNKEVRDFRAAVEKDVREIQATIDHNEIDRIRWDILDFANSCRNGRRHTKEEFDHIIDLHTKYERILEKNHTTNGQVTIAFEYIQDLYKRCMIENDFLA